jgi:transposase InsO family protein
MDLFSRKIIGWQVADSMAEELVIEALTKAILRERLPVGLIVHSDCAKFGYPVCATQA